MYRVRHLRNGAHRINSSKPPPGFALHTASYCLTTAAQEQPGLHPTWTMQSAEAKFNKNSLLLALRRYSSAVSDMEQTILLPSMLRDQVWDSQEAEESCRDLYGNYLMLKTIRNAVESGLFHLGDREPENRPELSDTRLDADPEALFRFHLSGLFSVMSDLTKKSQSLTEKYMDIIGVAN